MAHSGLPDLAYEQRLPRKRMSAGALFFDEYGRLLIVCPTYKPTWEIPGGVVDAGESPRQACIREIREELGLQRRPERLLCVDYISASADKTEALAFVFSGGVLVAAEIAAIRLPTEELSCFQFVEFEAARPLFSQRMQRRLAHCLAALPRGVTLYLEDQEPIWA